MKNSKGMAKNDGDWVYWFIELVDSGKRVVLVNNRG